MPRLACLRRCSRLGLYLRRRPAGVAADNARQGARALSNVRQGRVFEHLGCRVLPVDACDMADCPISRADIEPYFKKVAALMPLAGGEGTLSQAFPP